VRIKRLRLRNFRPFLGDHEIDLTPVGGNSLVIIQGENQSGKTAFFLALYWCLYGQARNRLGQPLPVFLPGEDENDYLINRKAVEAGDYTVQVEILFEQDGAEWLLTRTATCKSDPFDGGEFVVEPFLLLDDEPITTADIARRVNDVLHGDAAQYYFFDGELLSQYEQWLADPQQAQTRVRDAIERTVGVSAFRLGEHLEAVAVEFQKDVNKALRKEQKNKDLLDERDLKERRRTEIKVEIRHYDSESEKLSGEADRITKRSGDLTAWQAARVSIEGLETQITEEKRKQADNVVEIQKLVRERYWLPLDRRSQEMDTRILAQVEEAFSSRGALAATSLAIAKCELCDRAFDEAAKEHIERMAKLGAGTELTTVDDVSGALLRLEQARQFNDPSALSHLDTLENNLTTSRITIRDCEQRADHLRKQHPVRGDLEKEMERLKEINRTLGSHEKSRDAAADDLTVLEGVIKALDAKIAKIGTTDPALGRRSRAAALAAAAFEAALDEFSQRSREKVQEGATRAFKALVTDEGFDGIDISERYVVRPVDAAGKVQTAPSSGGQQLLTLALIAGLNGTAVHDAPIVMDTPFGRLDVGNRERILHWVDTLVREKDQQVVLMVHSGELTTTDLARWKITPGRSYRIVATDVHEHSIES
jgi:DNA sulfur modification protein DndD